MREVGTAWNRDDVRSRWSYETFVGPVLGVLILSGAVQAGAPLREPRQAQAAVHAWPMFRGRPQLTGVARGRLPDNLSVQWTFEAADAFESSACIVEETVYVGCDDGNFYALDLSNGALRWKFEVGAAIRSSPSCVDQRVAFGDDEGTLHVLDGATGRPIWTFDTGDQIISSPNQHAGRIVVGSYDGMVYCLDARRGNLIWKYETQGRVHGTVAVTEGFVIVAGCDQYLHVLRWEDGKPIRRIPMGSVSGSSAAILGSRVFLGTYGDRVLS
ncbi:MAG: PQQ-binding-like beta-propeller repeat protein, partial [Planctomycetes bacterium]|nr:PQQ-binding-like beta-propeller repeat protein [Planctomycetota bacterium]